MLLVRTSSQLPPNYNLASGGDTCHSFWQTQGESNRAGNVREGGNRRGAEPEREGMGNLILKGNEKHESRGKGREVEHGGVGGEESRETE